MKHKNKFLKITIALVTILSIVAAIVLPKLILERKVKHSLSQVVQAPDDYYLTARTATARNASSKLSSLDRISLICSTWDSSMSPCDTTEGFLTESQAISIAKSQLNQYYLCGLYPVSLFSNYNNWYSFNCNLYRYIDTSFESYSAYLWEIHFSKYDSTEYHTILMSESGTILAAETNAGTYTKGMSLPEMQNNLIENAFVTSDHVTEIRIGDITKAASAAMPHGYPQIDLTNAGLLSIYNIQLKNFGEDFNDYTLFQYQKENGIYGISLVPAE
ncbi:MAG: hypothetical protein NC225_03445 [Clostridium sp.]|nr:hypothetical protein [Clostridium sp.]MCM1398521.1 hypothetical protein [Clostridium sp.]MCM1460243.1 hypothetical protein [Bacteroides sp.]